MILDADVGTAAMIGVAALKAGGADFHLYGVGAGDLPGEGGDAGSVRQNSLFFLNLEHKNSMWKSGLTPGHFGPSLI